MTKPYTYLIGWSSQNLWYYGVRYAKGCDPSDLWTKYFTSSKPVKKTHEIYGEPDVISIRQTFDCIDSARLWEHKVLRRLKVVKNEKWLNQTDNMSIRMDADTIALVAFKNTGQIRKPHSPETIEKIRAARIGKEPWNKGKKMAIPSPMKGRHHTEESNEKNRQSHLGKTQTAESNKKRSETLKGRTVSLETREKLRLAAISREAKKKLQQ
jgi:hypothetical protein